MRARAKVVFAGRRRREPWQAAEDVVLRRGLGAVPDGDLALALRRTIKEVRGRAALLRAEVGSAPWSSADQALLRRLYGTRPIAALEVCFGRPAADIEAASARLCLRKDRRFVASGRGSSSVPRWTPADVTRLRALYPTNDNLAIAAALGRSVLSVANKANQLGLKKRKRWLRQTGRVSAGRRWGGGDHRQSGV